MTSLNPLPWPIANDMAAMERKLENILREIRLLNRPVPPKAACYARSMQDILDYIIKHEEVA